MFLFRRPYKVFFFSSTTSLCELSLFFSLSFFLSFFSLSTFIYSTPFNLLSISISSLLPLPLGLSFLSLHLQTVSFTLFITQLPSLPSPFPCNLFSSSQLLLKPKKTPSFPTSSHLLSLAFLSLPPLVLPSRHDCLQRPLRSTKSSVVGFCGT